MSFDVYPKLTIAAVQAAPVYFDRAACLEKVRRLTAEAKANGADLAVFSESFIPGFPSWVHMHAPMDQHGLFQRFAASSIAIPGPAFYALQRFSLL